MRTSLSMSMELLRWLRRAPGWSQLPLGERALLSWKARWGSINSRLSEAVLSKSSSRSLQAPILIVGPWRSGTTVMHELLYAAADCSTPLTWQCMNPCAFLLQGGNAHASTVIARPMDGLDISAQTPQEDEFALLSLGTQSAYRAFLQPQRLPELHETLTQDYWLNHPEWLASWESFLQGVLSTQKAELRERTLLLKSPNHTFRLQAILRRFPQAKLVWMARNPRDVWFSNQKMWKAMFAEHALQNEMPAGLDDFLVQAIQASADALNMLLDHSPRPAMVYCRQEDLRADPVGVTERVICELGLTRSASKARFVEAIARTARGKTESYDSEPPATADTALQALNDAQSRAERLLRG